MQSIGYRRQGERKVRKYQDTITGDLDCWLVVEGIGSSGCGNLNFERSSELAGA